MCGALIGARNQIEGAVRQMAEGQIVAGKSVEIAGPAAPKVPDTFDDFYASFIEAVFGITTLNRAEVYSAFFEQFGPFVVHLVSKRNKVTRNSREIVQELFKQLMEARLIEKFFDQARDSMPETITAEQAHRVLGVGWDQFRVAIWHFAKGYPEKASGARGMVKAAPADIKRRKTAWMPLPIEGSYQSKKAIYKTSEIMQLDAMEYFKKVGHKDHADIIPKPTRKHFQHYLSKCVHNRFANFCRTEDRHHKERLHDTFAELRPAVDDPTPWETRLPDVSSASAEVHAELGLLIRRIDRTPAAPLKNELFELLEDGYSMEEAIDKLDLATEAKRATKREVCGNRRLLQQAMAS
jgi:hypothetical protein